MNRLVLNKARWHLASVAVAAGLCVSSAFAINLEQLEPPELETLKAALNILEPVIAAKKQDRTANLLTWDELYSVLTSDQQEFIGAFRSLKAENLGSTSHYFGETKISDLELLGDQEILSDGARKALNAQHVPRNVLEAYHEMMDAMQEDLGKHLLIESGYRSPAYQLYLFLYYMKNHDYSITETNRFVALPGHSEHGYPPRQAIDFINQEGINGEYNPGEFEALPEYQWLQEHAHEYEFFLSYPRNNPYNTAFEPWHWHYEGENPKP